MPEKLPIIAQRAMDQFYQSYKASSEFFDLDDFVYYVGATIGDIFRQEAQLKYQEHRANKQDEVVGFPADMLVEQELKVKHEKGKIFAELEEGALGFSYDNQVIGIQDILPIKPAGIEFERTTQSAAWQFKYVPATCKVFWYPIGNRIVFQKKAIGGLEEVSVLYVPAIGLNMLVPDGIQKMAIDQTVITMKGMKEGIVEKKSVDGQGENKTIQTEMNKLALK